MPQIKIDQQKIDPIKYRLQINGDVFFQLLYKKFILFIIFIIVTMSGLYNYYKITLISK
jgi:hypothetical protein